MRERQKLDSALSAVRALDNELADTLGLLEMAEAENDAAMIAEAMASLRAAAEEAKRREIESLLSGEADANDCYIELNAGAAPRYGTCVICNPAICRKSAAVRCGALPVPGEPMTSLP